MLKDGGEMFEKSLESLHPGNVFAPEVPCIGFVAASAGCFHVSYFADSNVWVALSREQAAVHVSNFSELFMKFADV